MFCCIFVSRLAFQFEAITMTILFLWDNLSYMISFNYIMLALIASALVTPTVWLLNFSELGFLNSIGVVGNASFTLCVIGICIFNFDTITPMSTSIPPVTDISLSFGILLLCFAGHPCVPIVFLLVAPRIPKKTETQCFT